MWTETSEQLMWIISNEWLYFWKKADTRRIYPHTKGWERCIPFTTFIFFIVWIKRRDRRKKGWWGRGWEVKVKEERWSWYRGLFVSPFLSTGGAQEWSVETEWNWQELTAESQRREEPRTRAQTNAIVVIAQWSWKVTAEEP